MTDRKSRIAGFHRKSLDERLQALVERGFLTPAESQRIAQGDVVLLPALAEKMVENVVGVFGLPFAVAPNFLVNGRDYVVPMVVEEPSVVAGVSGAARLMRAAGGIIATADDPILVGQVQLTGVSATAVDDLQNAVPRILQQADGVQQRLVARGGGARDVDIRRLELPDGNPSIVVNIAIDTRDAMGANIVNTVCEALAPELESISGGRACLRILSNLADRSLVSAAVEIPAQALRVEGFSGEQVRDDIVLANDLALVDRYRAATHNKGIMNGIDPVAIATGNDWRAIEAGAHAYACRDGNYRALTEWTVSDSGALRGVLTLPLKVGIVGASLQSNPAVALGLALTGAQSATELGQLMCAVGLAQNFAALRALVSRGIQQGHMSLHARSVASVAGAAPEIFDDVVAGLIASGDIKQWKAEQLIAEMQAGKPVDEPHPPQGSSAGKVILLGEHAVVYGMDALALPLPDAMQAWCSAAESGVTLRIPDWGIRQSLVAGEIPSGAAAILELLLDELGMRDISLDLLVRSRLPMGMGLGSSAALAASLARALVAHRGGEMTHEQLNTLVFACEKIAHGRPSGIDNTVAVFAKALRFNKNAEPAMEILEVNTPPLLVAWGRQAGITREQVAGVRRRYEENRHSYQSVFEQIGSLAHAGIEALRAGRLAELGRHMNVCHGLLNAIGVSTPDLEHMVALARQGGAIGAKLTGAGGGGAIIALCPGCEGKVEQVLRKAGYNTLTLNREDH